MLPAQPVLFSESVYLEASIVEPPKFSRKISELENFIAKYKLAFNLYPSTFRNNHTKVLFVLGHLIDNTFQ